MLESPLDKVAVLKAPCRKSGTRSFTWNPGPLLETIYLGPYMWDPICRTVTWDQLKTTQSFYQSTLFFVLFYF